MASPKIIVLGSLNGMLIPAAQKLATLQAKNGFAMAILTGNAFARTLNADTREAVKSRRLKFPLPTYFTIGSHPLPEEIAAKVEADEEIGQNLYFLGKRGFTTTTDGVHIAVLGGVPAAGREMQPHEYNYDDVMELEAGGRRTDLLLTSVWPADIWKCSNVVLDPANQAMVQSSPSIADLCATLKPRYHLTASSGAFFYEREPFGHPFDSHAHELFTRFISLAPYDNEAKAKAMYAFSLNRSDDGAVPIGATDSPLIATMQSRKRPPEDEEYSRFSRPRRHGKRRYMRPPPGPDRCYFCLSNPNISTHMCCSIGEESYVTTAKGPIPETTTFAEHGLTFPGHFIIIPLPHAPTTKAIGRAEEAARAYNEMSRFRESLQAMLSSKSSHKLGAITWEISRESNIHLIWQLTAVPAQLIRSGLAEAGFRVEAENSGYPPWVVDDLPLERQIDYGDFLRIWLWADDGEDLNKGKSLVMPLPRNLLFDFQFSRRVIVKLLGLETRLSWQDCQQTVEEETSDAQAFREAFKDWDFTIS
ncbi:CwfJ domain-containing protein [Ophiocordyceps camponoti-floridani]|uniref:CwfJ domain-containing protein n=1 Tax=Ophiocordyceps camponoti-floridani TaxID=2030778 RepID=A0A8H4QC01_9HYPO|nr:CwfJ domain-containing protein [Ophiocordyceps camponoti-floridani]